MGTIRPMPVHIREYYKAMKDAYTQKKDDAAKELETISNEINVLQKEILERHEEYLKYNINLSEFPEFINNKYENGDFLRIAKGAYLNRSNNYELTSDLFNLLKLAKKQKEVYDLEKSIAFYAKILSFKANDYIAYIREYFNIVHKKMIIEGYGYCYGHGLGCVVINRVRVDKRAKAIDYQKTKKKKAEILARGGRIYNKEEAEFCERNGLEYDGEDGRVFMDKEYFYEIIMTHRMFKDYASFIFRPQHYNSAASVSKKTYDELIKSCNNDLNKICELNIDLKRKIDFCNQVDKTLYTNFIRNENQTSYVYAENRG